MQPTVQTDLDTDLQRIANTFRSVYTTIPYPDSTSPKCAAWRQSMFAIQHFFLLWMPAY